MAATHVATFSFASSVVAEVGEQEKIRQ